MMNDADLTDEQRLHEYHNPRFGDYRLAALSNGLKPYASDARGSPRWQRRSPEGPGAREPERDRA
jgi:hypothetical protein